MPSALKICQLVHITGRYKLSTRDTKVVPGLLESSFEAKNVQAFYSADIVCLGYPTHFTDQSVATDGIASWKWDFKDGTTSSIQNPVHTFGTSGTYNVKLVITSNGGVKDSLGAKHYN